MRTVPVIDFDGTTEAQLSKELGRAFQDIGFAVLTNHPIPRELRDRMYAITKQLFAHSDEVLGKYRREELHQQVGFIPQCGADLARNGTFRDLKRYWHVRRPHPATEPYNVWPEEVPEFQCVTQEMYEALDVLAGRLLSALDVFLGYPSGTLPGMVENGNTLLRVLHYPALDCSAPLEGERTYEHEDINLITLLVAATASGLEIKNRSGDWVSVDEEPGSIVVNVGDMLQLLTKWELLSSSHRVVNLPKERYSLPFFVHPRPEVILTPENGYTAGDYLAKRIRQIY